MYVTCLLEFWMLVAQKSGKRALLNSTKSQGEKSCYQRQNRIRLVRRINQKYFRQKGDTGQLALGKGGNFEGKNERR